MRSVKAKRLRREIYGDLSIRDTAQEIRCLGKRAEYQAAKRAVR